LWNLGTDRAEKNLLLAPRRFSQVGANGCPSWAFHAHAIEERPSVGGVGVGVVFGTSGVLCPCRWIAQPDPKGYPSMGPGSSFTFRGEEVMHQPGCFSVGDTDSQRGAPRTRLPAVRVPQTQQVDNCFLEIGGCAQKAEELEILREKARLQLPHQRSQQSRVPIQTLPERPALIFRRRATESLAKKCLKLASDHGQIIQMASWITKPEKHLEPRMSYNEAEPAARVNVPSSGSQGRKA
jgi:hypothetical protein